MKRLVVLACVLAVTTGCVGLQVQPPPNCENSWIYKTNFANGGPIVVRVATATWLAAQPDHKPAVRRSCVLAWQALESGNLITAISFLTRAFQVDSRYMAPAVVLLAALAEAGTVNGVQVALDPCDKNFLKSLVKNIGVDAGALPTDFP